MKIGFSKDPSRRLRDLQTAHPSPLVLFHKEEVTEFVVRAMEKAIHRTLKHKRTQGEWFSITAEDAIAEIKHAMIMFGDEDNLGMKMKSGYFRF